MKAWLLGVVGLALLAVIGWLLLGRSSAEHRGAQHARELATRALAECLLTNGSTKRVLIVGNPFARAGRLNHEMQAMENAGLRGLAATLSSKLPAVIDFPELKSGVLADPRSVFIDPETTTPLSYLVTGKAFDQLAEAHPDCDVIISLIGLPADLAHVECWQNSVGPRFLLLLPDLRLVGGRGALRRSFESGKLLAVVALRPHAPASIADPAGDWRAEFDRQFLLVTRENLEALLAGYPQIFPPN